MNFYIRLLLLLIVAAFITTGCSKNADPVPPEEETVENDTITFPHVMAVSTKKGLARIFTNGKEIFDSAYAGVFVAEAALYYFENALDNLAAEFVRLADQKIIMRFHLHPTHYLMATSLPLFQQQCHAV
jgi:hypothetical protein